MKTRTPPHAILQSATGLLGPFWPELTPRNLVAALNGLGEDSNRLPRKSYSMRQAEEPTGLSRFTIKREIERGNLKAVKLGAQWRITEAALREYMEGKENE